MALTFTIVSVAEPSASKGTPACIIVCHALLLLNFPVFLKVACKAALWLTPAPTGSYCFVIAGIVSSVPQWQGRGPHKLPADTMAPQHVTP